jgi:hypothetical protein
MTNNAMSEMEFLQLNIGVLRRCADTPFEHR